MSTDTWVHVGLLVLALFGFLSGLQKGWSGVITRITKIEVQIGFIDQKFDDHNEKVAGVERKVDQILGLFLPRERIAGK